MPRIDRTSVGIVAITHLLPELLHSPALPRICGGAVAPLTLLAAAVVELRGGEGQYTWVDVAPAQPPQRLVLSPWYLTNGAELDLYLDLLHELTHLRQLLFQNRDLWDLRFAYEERPTEVEGFAVAVEEGRRHGWGDVEVLRHLQNPWTSVEGAALLLHNVDAFLRNGALPHGAEPLLSLEQRAVIRVW